MKINITGIKNVSDILNLYPEANEKQLAKIKNDVIKDLRKVEEGSRIIYGAKSEEGIVGTAQLVFKDDKEYYADGTARAHIHHTRIAERLRGQGIGTMLMEVVEKEARRRGFTEMTLGVEEDNKKATQFYQHLGYKEFMREKGDEGETIIGMKKEL